MARGSRYVCVHGHFYQPPRENAWLETIETEDSAAPYHDWNERIDAECYAPNATARILDDEERIARIVNNYERISFNFGPTLLSWLERHDAATYEAILAADRASAIRFGGHGSAIAQAYNHAILPLCNARDKRTQVLWGLADFRRRFGREAEGLWLPETAADVATLEVLAAEGLRFTILAPRQAVAVKRAGARAFVSCRKTPLDPRRAYRMALPSGREIALFFYDGPISTAVAFEKLLARGDQFVARLLGAFADDDGNAQLVHLATDGETFGHHHTFGEMALAFALQTIDEGDDAELINYGRFLSLHPPGDEVRIAEPSSWSCEHGVGRWSRDCGCRAGTNPDWNQRWRRPLREALDGLRDDLGQVFESEAVRWLDDPWTARDRYVEIVLDRSATSLRRFFEANARRPLDPGELVGALRLLEMQRNAMLMFTSCGWFFDELSGIETRQILQYAARALELAGDLVEPGTEERLLKRLAEAQSNLDEHGTGRRLFETVARSARADLRRVAASHVAGRLFASEEADGAPLEGPAHELECDATRHAAGEARLVVGRLRVASAITLERETLCFAGLYDTAPRLEIGLRPAARVSQDSVALDEIRRAFLDEGVAGANESILRAFPESRFSLADLFRDRQRQIVRRILDVTLADVGEVYQRLYDTHAAIMHLLAGLDAHAPRALRVSAEVAAEARLLDEFGRVVPDPQRLRRILEEATSRGVSLDRHAIGAAARAAVERAVRKIVEQADDAGIDVTRRLLAMVGSLPFHVDLRAAQDTLYAFLRSTPAPPDSLKDLTLELGIAFPLPE